MTPVDPKTKKTNTPPEDTPSEGPTTKLKKAKVELVGTNEKVLKLQQEIAELQKDLKDPDDRPIQVIGNLKCFRKGQNKDRVIGPGTPFMIRNGEEFSKKWMKPVARINPDGSKDTEKLNLDAFM